MSTAYSKNTLCSYYNPRVVVCITVSKGKHTEEVLAHENAAECSKCIAVAGLAFAMSNCDVSVLKQGNLDWHGNPSWFLGLQDEFDFQTKISQKRLDILISFFLIIKTRDLPGVCSGTNHFVLFHIKYDNASKNQNSFDFFQKLDLCLDTPLRFWPLLKGEDINQRNLNVRTTSVSPSKRGHQDWNDRIGHRS